jgi:murein L,D-transpeptidase YafK
MHRMAPVLILIAGIVLAAAGRADAVRVTRIEIHKSAHVMQLFTGEAPWARFNVWIGPGGAGVKHREGDQVTPVGRYRVTRVSPSARYDIFLGLDYPNADDRARFREAKASGALPRGATIGGDIGIHGGSPDDWTSVADGNDWTLGCISVRNSEIERIASVVRVGTEVVIDD